MYDPLALDRQRVEQDRLRQRADDASRRPTRTTTGRRRGTVLAAVAALVPHPRATRHGSTEAKHALAPM